MKEDSSNKYINWSNLFCPIKHAITPYFRRKIKMSKEIEKIPSHQASDYENENIRISEPKKRGVIAVFACRWLHRAEEIKYSSHSENIVR